MANPQWKQKYDQLMLEPVPAPADSLTSTPVSQQLYADDGRLPLGYKNMNAAHMVVEERLQTSKNI